MNVLNMLRDNVIGYQRWNVYSVESSCFQREEVVLESLEHGCSLNQLRNTNYNI